MKKNNSLGLLSMTVGFVILTALSCSKDDGCENKTYYLDKDLDNYGAGAPTTTCAPPTSTLGQYVLKNGDLDDDDANVNPGCTLYFTGMATVTALQRKNQSITSVKTRMKPCI